MLPRRAAPFRSILQSRELGSRWYTGRPTIARSFQSYSRSSNRRHLTSTFAARPRTATETRTAYVQLSRRAASTNTASAAEASNSRRNQIIGVTVLLASVYGYFYFTDTRASVHKYVITPLLRAIFPDAEDAHHASVDGLRTLYSVGLNPRERGNLDADGTLSVQVFGHKLSNPMGVSAGLDKDGEIVGPLFDLGPAIVEIGGITPLPQEGNPKPRVFRVPSQEAVINRYGLNSKGAAHVARELRKRVRRFADAQGYGLSQDAEDYVLNGHAGVPPGSLVPGKLLAVQVAKNKVTPETDTAAVVRDYVSSVQQLGAYADIIVVNVSSPNTPGLRTLQQSEPLEKILTGVVGAAKAIQRRTKPYVMVKVSPDENSDEDINGICDAVWASGVDGVIVANTTRGRPIHTPQLLTASEASTLKEQGGYSGPALFDNTVSLVQRYRKALDAPLHEPALQATETEGVSITQKELVPKTIFASGGITSGEDMLKVCNAGASVAMAYTAFSYQGTGFFSECKRQMKERIREVVKTHNPIQSGKV